MQSRVPELLRKLRLQRATSSRHALAGCATSGKCIFTQLPSRGMASQAFRLFTSASYKEHQN